MEEKKVKIGEKYKCIASPRYTCFKIGDTYEIKDEFEAELISLCRDCFTLDEESEDEKVRQELTTFLINFNNGYYSKPSEDKIESWIKWIDKKCKHNPTNEVKPKFKVGDWVRAISSGNIFKILSVNGGLYRVLCYDGVEANYPIEDVDYDLAYWTIKDAKDGDVVADKSDGTIGIFQSIGHHPDGGSCNDPSYCFLHCRYDDVFFYADFENGNTIDSYCLVPATKEQRDILFLNMKEAGYEWDDDKKELKKIEQPSTDCSEDDEDMIECIIAAIKMGDYHTQDELNRMTSWLKSLNTKHWKPTDKQMEDFRMLLDYNIGVFDYAKFMSVDSLYEDLKKNLIDE